MARFPLDLRCPLVSLLAAATWAAGCSNAPSGEADSGFAAKIAKDAVVALDADGPDGALDAGQLDSAAADAFLPDAMALPDGDGDGIPDGEDPAPAVANPALFIDTFESVSPDWLFTSNAMRVEPARSLLRVPQPEPFVREGWIGVRPQWLDVLVRALVRVQRLGGSNDPGAGRVGVLARVQQVAPDRYLLCGFDLRAGVAFLSEHNGGDASGRTIGTTPITARAGEWVQINLSARGGQIRCTVAEGEITATSGLFTSGSSGFRAFDVAFEADWFEVYGL